MVSRRTDPRALAEAKLIGSLQRAIDLHRRGETEALEEHRAQVRDRWVAVARAGGDPGAVVERTWAREVNADLEVSPVELLGEVAA